MLWSEHKYKESIQHFNISHSHGCPDAAYHLGMIYDAGCDDERGFQITPDVNMAILYYTEAILKVIF